MDVSIVIPAYNRVGIVSHAIDSALRPAKVTTEVIVVDDGSTDGTAELLSGYGPRIVVIRQENRGVSAARNAGIAAARGTYVKFLDSDDVLIDGGIDVLFEASELDSSFDLIHFGDAVSDESGGPSRRYGFPNCPAGVLSRVELLTGTMSPLLPLFRAEGLRAIGGFNENLSFGEDQDLAVRLTAAAKIFVRVPASVVEIGHPQVARLSKSTDFGKSVALAEAIELTLRGGPMCPEEAVALSRWIWVLGREAARQGGFAHAASLFRQAEKLGGRKAWNASWPVKGAYALLSPVTVERSLEGIKAWLRR